MALLFSALMKEVPDSLGNVELGQVTITLGGIDHVIQEQDLTQADFLEKYGLATDVSKHGIEIVLEQGAQRFMARAFALYDEDGAVTSIRISLRDYNIGDVRAYQSELLSDLDAKVEAQIEGKAGAAAKS